MIGLFALLSGASIFLFCKDIRSFHKFMAYVLIFEGLVTILSAYVNPTMRGMYLLYAVMLLLCPVFYYFATLSFLNPEGVCKKDLWMIEAVAVYAIIFICVTSSIPYAGKSGFMESRTALEKAGCIIYLLEECYVFVFCAVSVLRYRRSLEKYYSNMSGKSWDKVVVLFSILGLKLIISVVPVPEVVNMAVSCAFYISVAVYVCKVKFTASELQALTAKEERRQMTPMANDAISSKLEKAVSDKFYLDPDIDLIGLSIRIQVNSKYVADYIRHHYNETFLSYVNRLRVEYSISLIEENKLSLTEIGEASGFSTASTFYRNFTKLKGISPSQYRNNG